MGPPGSKKFIQIDIELREMDSNAEIAAPLVGDIGFLRHRRVARAWATTGNSRRHEWTKAIADQEGVQYRPDGGEAWQELGSDGSLPFRAGACCAT